MKVYTLNMETQVIVLFYKSKLKNHWTFFNIDFQQLNCEVRIRMKNLTFTTEMKRILVKIRTIMMMMMKMMGIEKQKERTKERMKAKEDRQSKDR